MAGAGSASWTTPERNTYHQFIYNSSGAQANNRFNNWSDMISHLHDEEGPVIILFEQDETIPEGSWSLDNVKLQGNGLEYNAGGYTLTFGDNTTISSWENPFISSIRLLSTSTTGNIWTANGPFVMQCYQTSNVHSTNYPFIKQTGAGQTIISLENSARWYRLAGGVENLHIDTAANATTLIISRGSGASINNNTISSTAGVIFLDIISSTVQQIESFPSTHTNLNISFSMPLYLSVAEALGFNPAGTGMVSTNAQDAIVEAFDAAVQYSPVYGTYQPTAINVTNVDSSTVWNAMYTQLGDIVTVFGTVAVTPSSAAACQVDIPLPIASNLAYNTNLSGTATAGNQVGDLEGNATDDRASLIFVTPSTDSLNFKFSFMYQVL